MKMCPTCSHYKATYGGNGECGVQEAVWNRERVDGKELGTYGIDEDCPLWNRRRLDRKDTQPKEDEKRG